jgi:hypothetical protein
MSAEVPADQTTELSIDGWQFTPEGAAVHLDERTAVIADVHLGNE